MTEWEKMLRGEKYDAADKDLLKKLFATKETIWRFNRMPPLPQEERSAFIREFFGSCGKNPIINSPFHCDYGCNISVGDNFFANFNLVILDEAQVTIGNNVFIGPNVNILTACHPTNPEERNELIGWARPITIGDNVWIGGGVTILPGVSIGEGCTIGAGAVVVKDIPARSIAAGNPCTVIKKVES